MKKCKDDNHRLNWNECGYGGGSTADVWCNKCSEMVKVPIDIYKIKKPHLYNLWLIHNNNDESSNIND